MVRPGERLQNLRDVRHELGPGDRNLPITLPEKPNSFRRAVRAHRFLDQPFQAVADHATHVRDRQRLSSQPSHREGKSVRDRRITVDECAVEIEDEEGRLHGLRRGIRSRPESRSTRATIASGSPNRTVGSSSLDTVSEIRATAPAKATGATPARRTSILGIGSVLYPSTRTRSQEANSREISWSRGSSGPRRRAVVLAGVTRTDTAAPESECRCESLPGTSSSTSLEVCLITPTVSPIAFSLGTSSRTSVVLPELCAPTNATAAGFRSG